MKGYRYTDSMQHHGKKSWTSDESSDSSSDDDSNDDEQSTKLPIPAYSTRATYISYGVLKYDRAARGECQQENEMLMMSEIARRILEERKYISYGALNRNQPACGGPRGQAYSSNSECLGPAANPYHRGCSKYYRCRSDT
uniref:Uncharacterized protein n=1 Tax=Chenopodium quinoa TaxID=63459 RepID=A0A803LZH3_CHEQI